MKRRRVVRQRINIKGGGGGREGEVSDKGERLREEEVKGSC